ncbi:Receptor protein-tyrosine kinase CEPR2 [Linum grandiflorum]
MSSLQTLYLDGSGFAGLMPHQLGNLSNLLQLGLMASDDDYVLYADSLQRLSGLPSMEYLDLDKVTSEVLSLTSSVTLPPSELFNCLKTSSMVLYQTLHLHQNQLLDQLPHQLGLLVRLLSFDVSGNRLSRAIQSGGGMRVDRVGGDDDPDAAGWLGNKLGGLVEAERDQRRID